MDGSTKKTRALISLLGIFCALVFAAAAVAQAPREAIPAEAQKAIEDLSHGSPAQRAWAACALRSLRTASAIPLLIGQLSDETAVFAATRCQPASDWTPSNLNTKGLMASPASEAAKALAALGEPAVAPLIGLLTDPNPVVRKNAAWALGEIRGGYSVNREAAIAPLITLLRKDESGQARKWAAWALGEICDRRAVSDLIDALEDADAEVRASVAEALGEIKDRRAIEPLTLALKDHHRPVRRKARYAIEQIKEWLDLHGDRPVRQQ
ncbi:MAG: HEAT repeat domain-containing protein [Blastocatellia bacterium]